VRSWWCAGAENTKRVPPGEAADERVPNRGTIASRRHRRDGQRTRDREDIALLPILRLTARVLPVRRQRAVVTSAVKGVQTDRIVKANGIEAEGRLSPAWRAPPGSHACTAGDASSARRAAPTLPVVEAYRRTGCFLPSAARHVRAQPASVFCECPSSSGSPYVRNTRSPQHIRRAMALSSGSAMGRQRRE